MLAQRKFSRFSKMDMESEEARIFVAVEDWLNDGKDLPAGIARECILDWFINNGPCSGKWLLDGRVIEPGNIEIPVHIVASRKDQLVEYDAALSVRHSLPHAHLTEPDCGHIGMIAGKNSILDVWQPIAHWMKKQTCHS
jgi:polyhydroxyalkanoate synthase